MKLNKKKVFVSALAVSVIAILSMGSIAWFTASDSVTNTFKVAISSEEANDIFSVDVWEKVDTDEDGVIDTTLEESGYTYETILPGDVLVKQPIIVNTGSYDEYIRVQVTIDNKDAWVEIFETYGYELEDCFDGFEDDLWVRSVSETTETEDTLTYVYYYNGILEPLKESDDNRVTLFTHVVIPEDLTQEDMAKFEKGTFTLSVVAEAVQTENVGTEVDNVPVATAEAAVTAFETVGLKINE